jgi:hypothetical protein
VSKGSSENWATCPEHGFRTLAEAEVGVTEVVYEIKSGRPFGDRRTASGEGNDQPVGTSSDDLPRLIVRVRRAPKLASVVEGELKHDFLRRCD